MTLSSTPSDYTSLSESSNRSAVSESSEFRTGLDSDPVQSIAELNADRAVDATPWRKLFKKLKGGLLVAIGYLLSPLCWWNDLIFNLPIAYAFGAICNAVVPHSFFGGAIAGYWLSNVVGILMMQFGATEMVKNDEKPHNFQKTLWTGLLSSTAYTIAIVALVQFGILTLPEGLTFQD